MQKLIIFSVLIAFLLAGCVSNVDQNSSPTPLLQNYSQLTQPSMDGVSANMAPVPIDTVKTSQGESITLFPNILVYKHPVLESKTYGIFKNEIYEFFDAPVKTHTQRISQTSIIYTIKLNNGTEYVGRLLSKDQTFTSILLTQNCADLCGKEILIKNEDISSIISNSVLYNKYGNYSAALTIDEGSANRYILFNGGWSVKYIIDLQHSSINSYAKLNLPTSFEGKSIPISLTIGRDPYNTYSYPYRNQVFGLMDKGISSAEAIPPQSEEQSVYYTYNLGTVTINGTSLTLPINVGKITSNVFYAFTSNPRNSIDNNPLDLYLNITSTKPLPEGQTVVIGSEGLVGVNSLPLISANTTKEVYLTEGIKLLATQNVESVKKFTEDGFDMTEYKGKLTIRNVGALPAYARIKLQTYSNDNSYIKDYLIINGKKTKGYSKFVRIEGQQSFTVDYTYYYGTKIHIYG